jgi:DNA-binding winged helix-turn-helix (wHTH) protein
MILCLLCLSAAARADDAVLEWNQIAFQSTVTAGQGPNPQVRSMAIVQVSVHDAVNAITCDYRTYLSIGCGAWGSPDAAAIGAAHHALVSLFPSQAAALNQARDASLSARGLTVTSPGVAFGAAVAAALVAVRSTDGAAQATFPYTAPNAGDPGVWVAVGPAAPVAPGWGAVALWVIPEIERFRPAGPPALHSRRYARDYNEVRELGASTSDRRTAEQTEIARFWLGSPTAIWNGVARQLIVTNGLDLSASARTLALMYLASGDAGIVCWDTKYSVNFWRPLTAIHNGDSDGNDHTVADPTWTPLFPTPQHPEYISGHSTNSSAMATALMHLFGDKQELPIVATSPTNPGFERSWSALTEGVEEVIEARIYSGIHYRTSDEHGAEVGRRIGRFVANHARGGLVLYRFDRFTLDHDIRQLFMDRTEVHLSPKAFELLTTLLENRARAVSKTELQQHLWPATFVEETNLAGLVAEIRRALHDSAASPAFVRTVYGFGYRFVGNVRVDPPLARAERSTVKCYLVFDGREIVLMEGATVIGREVDTTIQVDARGVSRRHARIVVSEGAAVLEDLDSKNGTHVNGQRIAGPTPLSDRDVIGLGTVSLEFRVASPASPTETMPTGGA